MSQTIAYRGDTILIPFTTVLPAGSTSRCHLRETEDSDTYYVLSITDGNIVIPPEVSAACSGTWLIEVEFTSSSGVVETKERIDVFLKKDVARTYGAEGSSLISDLERRKFYATEYWIRNPNNTLTKILDSTDLAAMIALADQVADDAAQTALDVIQTGQDVVSTNADASQTALDAIATAADRVQTGLDRTQTGQDRTQTGLDRTATGQDKIATAADRVQTGLDASASSASASAALQSELNAASSAAAAALGASQIAKGTWNASTNTPTLADGTGTSGWWYIVSVAGTSLGQTFVEGDMIMYNGATWDRIPKSLVLYLNDQWQTVMDYASNVSNLFKLSKDNTIQFGFPVELSSLFHVLNQGVEQIVDMPISSDSPSGTEHGIEIVVGGVRLLKLIGISDGAGGFSSTYFTINNITPLTGTKVYYVSDTSGGATTRKLTFIDGLLTSES